MPEPATEPTLAEQARTALALAKIATLVTKGCPTRPGTVTVVSVEDQPDGRPLLRLEASSPTVRELGARRVATLAVPAPAPFWRVELTGALKACGATRAGQRLYRLPPLACRLVGPRSAAVSLSQFHAAQPDPLRGLAPALLKHLAEAHAQDLLACVRAHDYDAATAVVPLAVDRYGIELVALGDDGVERVRLPFPGGPIEALDQAPQGLVVPLTCRCRGVRSHEET